MQNLCKRVIILLGNDLQSKGDKMSKNIKFDASQNPALNFAIIIKDLERIAKESEIPVSKVMSDFMVDLQNYYNEDYEKKIEEVNLEGEVSPQLLNNFKAYLNRNIKLYQKKERDLDSTDRKNKKKEAEEKYYQEKLEEIVGSIDGNIMNPDVLKRVIDSIENNKELNRRGKKIMITKLNEKVEQFNKTWESIEKMVEKLSNENEGKTKPEYWQAIKDLINKKDERLNIKMNRKMREQMINMIDEKILDEKDALYYEQVKNLLIILSSLEIILRYIEL